ncbi:hypothetical protein PENTCL1PPCAC_8091, partial [Pristionchus entomophagus]
RHRLCLISNFQWNHMDIRENAYRQLDLDRFLIFMKNVEDVWILLERLGNFNRETRIFTATNLNQRVRANTVNKVVIEEGNLEFIVKGIEANEDGEIISLNVSNKKARFVQIRRICTEFGLIVLLIVIFRCCSL